MEGEVCSPGDTISREMDMKLKIAIIASTLLVPAGYAQTKAEFDVASIRVSPPREGFHFAADSGGGEADLSNPGMFRCSNCTLATLIRKAFNLQNYQFPGKSTLGSETFEVMAKIPAGAAPEDYRAMLQTLLKDRFGLTYHFSEKTLRGYHMVVAKGGSKLKVSEDTDTNRPKQNGSSDEHRFGAPGQDHAHKGMVSFNGTSTYRGDHQTTGDLAQILSDQLMAPVDDQTNLPGKYDIALTWTGTGAGQSPANHVESGGAFGGHGDHGGGGAGPAGSKRDELTPSLFEAVQMRLGLKLVPSDQAVARIFVVDRAERLPSAN
jgi:uncharacterized protein (TIGR03435 family)